MNLWRITRYPVAGVGAGIGFVLANHESLENSTTKDFLIAVHTYPLLFGGLGFIWPVPLIYYSMLKFNQLYRFVFQHRLLIVPKRNFPSSFTSSD